MKPKINSEVEAVLQCPNCGEGLTRCSEGRFVCSRCDLSFVSNSAGSLDLRLQKPKTVDLSFQVPCMECLTDIPWCDDLPMNLEPQVDFDTTSVPHHLTKEIMSYFPKASKKDSLMLDLGCGNTVHREVCEHAGFTYVGVDYENPQAPYLADAHALPFRDCSFEFLLSVAVLEHIQFPFLAIREAQRILKPGGIFIGTVAFLEPFHSNSFYHHSRIGTLNTLRYGGFEIVQIAASTSWTVFAAQAKMIQWILFPRVPRAISSGLILLPQKMAHIWWKLSALLKPGTKRDRRPDILSGAFYFVARKPDA